jgi:hypothetical protein
MTDPGPAAYSLYDVLRTLIDRVGWPTEVEKRLCTESVNLAESMAIFGNLAQMMTCKHEPVYYTETRYVGGLGRVANFNGNKCAHCGKIL